MCSDAVSHFHFIAQEIQTNSKNYSTKVLRDDVSWQLFRFSGFLTEQLFLVQGPSSCCFLRLPLSCLPVKQHYAVNSLQEVPNSHLITLHSVGCSYVFTYDLLKIRTHLKLPLILERNVFLAHRHEQNESRRQRPWSGSRQSQQSAGVCEGRGKEFQSVSLQRSPGVGALLAQRSGPDNK